MRADRKKRRIPRGSDDGEQKLKNIMELKAKGWSHSAIARHLRTTKNSISGIVFRFQKVEGQMVKTNVAKQPRTFGNRNNVVSLPELAAKPLKMPKGRPSGEAKFQKLMDSGKPGTCLWITGPASGRKFCGVSSVGSWCPEHRKKVFIPCKPSANQDSLLSPFRVGRR